MPPSFTNHIGSTVSPPKLNIEVSTPVLQSLPVFGEGTFDEVTELN